AGSLSHRFDRDRQRSLVDDIHLLADAQLAHEGRHIRIRRDHRDGRDGRTLGGQPGAAAGLAA
ncbi:MAG TPA: hypothetical protein VGI78_09935, partial [Acetobacteraceae bacterium]